MSSTEDPRRMLADRVRRRDARVRNVAAGGSVAYVPGRILVRESTLEREQPNPKPESIVPDTRRLTPRKELAPTGRAGRAWVAYETEHDAVAAVEVLRAEDVEAQLDHVLFAHGCDPCCSAPHPSVAFRGDPLHGNPLHGNPLHGNPLHGNPLHGNPFTGNPLHGNASTMSSAVPAPHRVFPVRELDGPGRRPRILIMDTGLASTTGGQRPPLLTTVPPDRISGDVEVPDSDIATESGTTFPADTWLDPVAGHGTFIAGIIEQLAPGCTIHVQQLLNGMGDGSELAVTIAISALAVLPEDERPDLLSLSFGGSVMGHPKALGEAIAEAQLAGITVVASAGNDGVAVPQYPAALPGVIAVGAVGPDGPPPWTNYGEWVDACAPGVDIVSSFFYDFDGPSPRINTVDIDDFDAWACWSGTSFSAPVVVAALAREMVLGGCSAKEAAERTIRAPHLLRIPCLGTVVNI